jgi:hypothetical protein
MDILADIFFLKTTKQRDPCQEILLNKRMNMF